MVNEISIHQAKIIIADDQELNVRMLEEIFTKAGYTNVYTVTDSMKIVDLYQEVQPDLLVLDLIMPGKDGFQVMAELNDLNKKDSYLPIMVISNQEDQAVRYRALASGAKDFLNKPYDRIEVLKRIHNLIEVRMLHNEISNQNVELEKKVEERTQQLYSAQVDVIQRLARAIEYRDSETGMHVVRMSKYAFLVAKEMKVTEEDCKTLLTAAPLHDIGKIGIPDKILLKPGKLTPEEWDIMKTHTTIGAELLSGSSDFMRFARDIALTHHERWDGTGYPRGLKGSGIPLFGRICCISDVFDALTTARPYKRAWTPEEALGEIKAQQEKMFDPEVVGAFVKAFPQINEFRQSHLDPQHEDVPIERSTDK